MNQVAGFALLLDLQGFSEKTPAEQRNHVAKLGRVVDAELKKVKWGSPSCQPYVNCTGDGFMLAFPEGWYHGGKLPAGAQFPGDWCVHFSSQVLTKCAKEKPPVGARVAICRGLVHSEPLPVFGGQHLLGEALNHAARISGYADAGQIVVNAEFRDAWVRARHGDKGAGKRHACFLPDGDAIAVPVKHGRQQRIYVYSGGMPAGNVQQPPASVQRLEVLNKRLRSELQRLLDHSLKFLREDLGLATVQARLSLFADRAVDQAYEATEYRLDTQTDKPTRSMTHYKYDSRLRGPVGVAGKLCRPAVVLVQLVGDKRSWEQAMIGAADLDGVSQGWTAEELATPGWFGTKASTILAWPVTLVGNRRADAVLCLDLDVRFAQDDGDNLRALADILYHETTARLAPLWMLRGG